MHRVVTWISWLFIKSQLIHVQKNTRPVFITDIHSIVYYKLPFSGLFGPNSWNRSQTCLNMEKLVFWVRAEYTAEAFKIADLRGKASDEKAIYFE